MIEVQKVDTNSKSQVNEFVQFHYTLYAGQKQWVPPFRNDIKMMLDHNKHPFYEHSDGEFFVARQNGKVVGRIGLLENKPYNKYHDTRKANFYLFDVVDDQEVASALFDMAFDWCRKRNLDTLVGPKGLSLFDGYGIQVEGFEQRQMMTMMNYNFPYYPRMMENMGFEKEVDFISCYLPKDRFRIPDKMREVARRVEERGKFRVLHFRNKSELVRQSKKIGEAYNKSFVQNWEYWPMTEREIQFTVDAVLMVAVPSLIKLIAYNDDIVGFFFGFPDISRALQRHNGKLNPISIADFLLELKRSDMIAMNGAGVLPEYQGRGGNALMYYEMEKTLLDSRYRHGELTQVAESAVQMRKDLIIAGGQPYKNHRVFRRAV
jgi:GNAT superfamily N-acetyltransferase